MLVFFFYLCVMEVITVGIFRYLDAVHLSVYRYFDIVSDKWSLSILVESL